MRSEFIGVTAAFGAAILLSYYAVTLTPSSRKAALGPWTTGRSDWRLRLWAIITPITAAAFVAVWYAVAFSGTVSRWPDLVVFVMFLSCALLFPLAIIEDKQSASISAVWLTAAAACALLIVPGRTDSDLPASLLWVAVGVVVFHHVVIDGVLWAGGIMHNRNQQVARYRNY